MPARALWLILGLVSTGCGIAGAVLPLVPTTPFLLLAAFAFARSSPRLHDWLVTHPRLGPPINDWRAHGAISRRAKMMALLVMIATLALSIAMDLPGAILLVQGIAMAGAATFILTRPDRPQAPD
ncbi:MAG: YbaN family protein [Hyphomicrobiaceae bacterium]